MWGPSTLGPCHQPSEGTPEPPHRSPPGPLRMLKNDEVLPFSGACHFLLSFCVSFSNCRDSPFRFFFPGVPLFSYVIPSLFAFPISLSAFFFSRVWVPLAPVLNLSSVRDPHGPTGKKFWHHEVPVVSLKLATVQPTTLSIIPSPIPSVLCCPHTRRLLLSTPAHPCPLTTPHHP